MADENLPAVQETQIQAVAPTGLFGSDNPDDIVMRASKVAASLARVIREQKLATAISGRDHVRVEGWTLLGTMLGVFPVCTWTRPLENGWEARVEARTLAGAVVGSAEAMCTRDERTWSSRDDYALRSMAQTRATAKCLRLPLGFVMQLAGYDPTPAEEMPRDENGHAKPIGKAATRLPDPSERPRSDAAQRYGTISVKQVAMFEAKIKDRAKSIGCDPLSIRDRILALACVESPSDLTWHQFDAVLKAINAFDPIEDGVKR